MSENSLPEEYYGEASTTHASTRAPSKNPWPSSKRKNRNKRKSTAASVGAETPLQPTRPSSPDKTAKRAPLHRYQSFPRFVPTFVKASGIRNMIHNAATSIRTLVRQYRPVIVSSSRKGADNSPKEPSNNQPEPSPTADENAGETQRQEEDTQRSTSSSSTLITPPAASENRRVKKLLQNLCHGITTKLSLESIRNVRETGTDGDDADYPREHTGLPFEEYDLDFYRLLIFANDSVHDLIDGYGLRALNRGFLRDGFDEEEVVIRRRFVDRDTSREAEREEGRSGGRVRGYRAASAGSLESLKEVAEEG